MSTHKICFHEEIRIYIFLSRAMQKMAGSLYEMEKAGNLVLQVYI